MAAKVFYYPYFSPSWFNILNLLRTVSPPMPAMIEKIMISTNVFGAVYKTRRREATAPRSNSSRKPR